MLEPLVDGLVDKVYAHLFAFDVTKSAFMPKAERALVGDAPLLVDLHHLRLDAPQVTKVRSTWKNDTPADSLHSSLDTPSPRSSSGKVGVR